MLERVVAWVLNSYIGEYFGNVNTDQLSVALQKGEVELEGLPLKPDALKHWGLPINVKAGYIGRITLKIPVYRLRSEPWQITIKELYLVAQPIADFSYNEELEKKIMQDYKMNLLDSLELKFQSQYDALNQESTYYASSYSSWLSTTTSFVASIVENLQLKIESVHLRYENDVSQSQHLFACGLIIKNLAVQSADQDWTPSFVHRDPSSDMRKLVTLDDFQLYWDDNTIFVADLPLPELISNMQTLMVTCIGQGNKLIDHRFILSSVTGQAKMRKNCSEKPLRSAKEPRLVFDLTLKQFPVSISACQYRQLLDWLEISGRINNIWKHRKYRPVQSIHGNALAWWKFAVDVHLAPGREKRRRLKWDFLLERARGINSYFKVYYSFLLQPESLNSEMRSVKERVEYELSFDELCCLRELVYEKIKRNKEQLHTNTKTKGQEAGWFNSWFSGWYSETASTEQRASESLTDKLLDQRESLEIENEIQKSLLELEEELVNNFESIENDTFLKRDAVFAQLNFVIEQASFQILSDEINKSPTDQQLQSSNTESSNLPPLLNIEFSYVEVNAETRPRYCSHEIRIKLGELYVRDCTSSDQPNRRYLMSSEFGERETKAAQSQLPKHQYIPKTDFMSTSLPSIPSEIFNNLENYASLPTRLHNRNIYSMMDSHNKRKRRKKEPAVIRNSKNVMFRTNSPDDDPPLPSESNSNPIATEQELPSETEQEKEDGLVKVTLLFVDKTSSLFEKKFGGINRFVNIEFNRLETYVINEVWAVVLNFFNNKQSSRLTESDSLDLDLNKNERIEDAINKEWSNSQIDITVNELSLKVYKSENEPLAQISITKLCCFSTIKNGNLTSEGSLGNLTITDLTSSGKVYKERFLTSGDEALKFEFFKFGRNTLHSNKQDYDMRFDCKMSLVQYVHSQRFFTELLNFWHEFTSMEISSRSNANNQTSTSRMPRRGSRLLLNVDANAPVIIIPINSLCDHVLVADFGQLEIRNRFAFAGSTGTISTVCKKSGLVHSDLTNTLKKSSGIVTRVMAYDNFKTCKNPALCLLDVINVNLTEMDLFKGIMVHKQNVTSDLGDKQLLQFPSFQIQRLPGKILKNKFQLLLQLERNLDGDFSRSVPDISMKGQFSAVHCTLNPSTYKLMRGILEHNLGEPVNHLRPMQTFSNEKSGLNTILTNSVWTSMAIHLDLNNVTLEIIDTPGSATSNAEVRSGIQPLAQIDFISSHLSIESFTDSSKDIDLVSQEIRIIDTRYDHLDISDRPNVFSCILQSVHQENMSQRPLQMEIHYRSKPSLACLTVLLNSMRLIGIFDWIKTISDFLLQTFNFETMDNFNSEIASHFRQLLEYQSQNCPSFELRINVTDTEFVVVEDSSMPNTNAVILRGTSVLNMTTDNNQKEPFNCSLERLEVFSCIFGQEQEETSLSIVDPLNFTISLIRKTLPVSYFSSIDDRRTDDEYTFVVEIGNLATRLSFNDITLFAKILNSLPNQTQTFSRKSYFRSSNRDSIPRVMNVNHLQEMGFDRNDCSLALEACQGNLQDAAIWLTQNSSLLSKLDDNEKAKAAVMQGAPSRFSKFFAKAVVVQIHKGNLTLIDDCKDTDVPLFELNVAKLNFQLKKDKDYSLIGKCLLTLACDYYNRGLSGWEPFLEPWTNQLSFRLEENKRLSLKLESNHALNIVITNTFLYLMRSVNKTWTDEYRRLQIDQQKPTIIKRRNPFVPFAIRNETGCTLDFALVHPASDRTISRQKVVDEHRSIFYNGIQLNLIQVESGQLVPFQFDRPGKIRHQDTHLAKENKILVRIDGWYEMLPVSVDKVGICFREARPKDIRLETTRIVFEITLQPNAVKLVTVRSALLVSNCLHQPIELSFDTVAKNKFYLPERRTMAVPLKLIRAKIFLRPINLPVTACRQALEWEHLWKQGERSTELFCCSHGMQDAQAIAYEDDSSFFFCVDIQRDRYPPDKLLPGVSLLSYRPLPGHQISLLPPLSIRNLLPCELRYYINNNPDGRPIGPGEQSVEYVDVRRELCLHLTTDNYIRSTPLILSPGATKDFFTTIELFDHRQRPLLLTAQFQLEIGSSLSVRLSISAPYLFINRTGLPLIFRQENVNTDASGQLEDHEAGRSIIPLLFSFSDCNSPPNCLMRLGRSLGNSHWSSPFSLDTGVRSVLILTEQGQRIKTFEIGIEIRNGKGRLRNTCLVTFSPCYQIENRCSKSLLVAQKCFTESNSRFAHENFVRVLSNSSVAFHWPETSDERKKLLCVRLQSPDKSYHWSGGFYIGANTSLHVNVRDENAGANLLHVEMLQAGATIYIVISEANQLPPPIRIDNHSEVALLLQQSNCNKNWQRWILRPHSSCAYAWDEPVEPHFLTVQAPGGCTGSYDLTIPSLGRNLTYENFIYIAFTETFTSEFAVMSGSGAASVSNKQLVLEVCEGNNTVILSRKEPGRRTQLWRMDSSGRLFHFSTQQALVLDITGQYMRPASTEALMLRKVNPERSYTQCWYFTPEGRLCCEHSGVCVQPKGGLSKLQAGTVATLAPYTFSKTEQSIPAEQAVGVQKMRSGSGMLSVRVLTDGPSRVLQITDFRNQPIHSHPLPNALHESFTEEVLNEGMDVLDLIVTSEANYFRTSMKDNPSSLPRTPLSPLFDLKLNSPSIMSATTVNSMHIQLNINVQAIGFSLVNHRNEELVYALLQQVIAEYTLRPSDHLFNCYVRSFQADNQLREATKPVLLCRLQHTSNQSLTPAIGTLPAITGPSDTQNNNQILRRTASASTFSSTSSEYSQQTPDVNLPIIRISARKLRSPRLTAHFFEHFQLHIADLCLNLEEQLILLIAEMLQQEPEELFEKNNGIDELRSGCLNIGQTSCPVSIDSQRFYFGLFELQLRKLRLSVYTNTHLGPNLQQIKRMLGTRLIRFEDAKIKLESFQRTYSLDTVEMLRESIVLHYQTLLKNQAAKILGSVDFLGNPIGFVNDMTEGINELIDGNISGMLMNISHGISDSTAKFTSVLSDSLGAVTMDQRHQEIRKRLRQGGSSEPLKAGFYGLGFGILGGITSIITQTYEGAVQEGGSINGAISGFGKGVLGTFTKPAVGVLDLASSAATVVRDRSRKLSLGSTPVSSSSRSALITTDRQRLPRQSYGISGSESLLPRYDAVQATGQHLFYSSGFITDREDAELFSNWCWLLDTRFALMLSSERVRVLLFESDRPLGSRRCIKGQLSIPFSNLLTVQTVITNELGDATSSSNASSSSFTSPSTSSSSTASGARLKTASWLQLLLIDSENVIINGQASILFIKFGSSKPAVQCSSELACEQAFELIQQAKSNFEERKFCLNSICKFNKCN